MRSRGARELLNRHSILIDLFLHEICRVSLSFSGSHACAADYSIILLRFSIILVLSVKFIIYHKNRLGFTER